jgi:S1-C subfamily serine protease
MWLKLISFSPLDGVCRVQIGLFKGSSGGAVVNRAGEVIAVHVESFSSKMTVDDAKSKSLTSDMISVLSDAVDSSAHSHNSTSKCMVISAWVEVLQNLT